MSDEDSTPDETAPKKRRPHFRIIAVVILAIVTLVLVLQNTETVETRILFATVAMPRAVLLIITFLLGIIVGLLMAFIRKRRK